jgi:hypothetical protein
VHIGGGIALLEVLCRRKGRDRIARSLIRKGYILSLLGLCIDLMKPPPMVPKNPMLMVAFEQGGILYEVLLPLPLLVVMPLLSLLDQLNPHLNLT